MNKQTDVKLESLSKDELIKLLLREQAVAHKFTEALATIDLLLKRNHDKEVYIQYTVNHVTDIEELIRAGEASSLLSEARTRLQSEKTVTLKYLREKLNVQNRIHKRQSSITANAYSGYMQLWKK